MNDIVAIFLTHGHEDHIGAVPYLLKEKSDIPIIGSQLTIAFLATKLKERRIKAELRIVKEGAREKIDPFDLEYIAVNHSIPDALAVAVRTDAGTFLHTGDFKMDQLPLDGRVTDLQAFSRLGKEGVDLFFVDSTNADIPGFTISEREILPVLDRVVASTKRRVIVASFASHVHRIQQVIDIAAEHQRKVAFIGRSMVKNMGIADELGFLHIPPHVMIDEKDLDKHGDNVVLICTGSQGEPLAALSRMANGDHQIRVGEGDTVIFASSLIPGNENSVYRVINELTRFGARVVHKGNALVHVSGHSAAGELMYCYNLVKPKNVVPVHGEWRHMRANADLAIKCGVPAKNAMVIENGVAIDLESGNAKVVGAVPCGYVYVDGQTIGEITEASLKDRRVLGEEGFISVIVVIDSQNGRIVAGPDIHARGFTENQRLFDEVTGRIESALGKAVNEGINGTHQLSQIVRKTVGSWVGEEHRRRPMIVPVVIEV
jgi:ribonuclease J